MVLIKELFATDLKQYSFCPSANVRPMSNDLVHAMPWQCMFAISVSKQSAFLAGKWPSLTNTEYRQNLEKLDASDCSIARLTSGFKT